MHDDARAGVCEQQPVGHRFEDRGKQVGVVLSVGALLVDEAGEPGPLVSEEREQEGQHAGEEQQHVDGRRRRDDPVVTGELGMDGGGHR